MNTQLNLRPSLEEFIDLSAHGNLISVVAELPSDLDTPVSLYLRLADDSPSFLLESVTGGENVARYSFIGVRMREALVLRGQKLQRHRWQDGALSISDWQPQGAETCADVLEQLRCEMARFRHVDQTDLPRFIGGYLGYTGYDVVRQFEQLPATATTGLPVPDAVYLLADVIIAFDHARQRLMLIANAHIHNCTSEEAYQDALARIKTLQAHLRRPVRLPMPDPNAEATPAHSNFSKQAFCDVVRQAKEHVIAGDTFQIQISRRVTRRSTAHPFEIYRALRRINPSPWMVYLNFGHLLPLDDRGTPLRLIIASPELHARFEDGVATVRPIAGTRRRGRTPAEDRAMAAELISDPKERAEHVMLVDLGRNDIGRIAITGTVRVPELMHIENYSHVMHIVSSVQGDVRKGLDMFDVLRATFPMGTLTGAPKVRTMQLIEKFEGERRHIYGGCAGYFGFNGQMDTCIVIRTIVMIGDACYMQAAGGVVYDSVPELEYKETENKLRACMLAIDAAEAGI